MPGSGLRQLLLQEAADIAQIDTDGLHKLLQNYRPDMARRSGISRLRQQREKPGDISNIIAYILNRPVLAMLVEDPAELSGITVPGADFVRELITLVHSNPEITCAGILEHWRGSRYETRLNELASGPGLPGDEDFDLEGEFVDRVEKLKAAKARQSIQEITRTAPSQLSDEDKKQLRRRYSSDKK